VATGRNPRGGGKTGVHCLTREVKKNPGFSGKMDPKGSGGCPHHGVNNNFI